MCIEVCSDDGARLLLDLGMPLYDESRGEYPRDTPQRPTKELLERRVLPHIAGLYAEDPSAPDLAAIVLTHAHIDHYGLAHHAHPAIPVYGSEGTIALLEVGALFFPDNRIPPELRVLPADRPLPLEGIVVTAIPVDHAAPDSRALLVEADGQRLLYTGDLRAHGRTGFRFENMLSDPRLRDIDWLLVEGTTLGAPGDGHGLRSESDVEDRLTELARDNPDRILAVIASGQNVDRLVSCYRAARHTGRFLVIDPYQAFVLMKLSALSESIPQFTWSGVRVSFAPHQVERLRSAGMMELVYRMSGEGKVTSDQLAEDPGRYLACMRGGHGTTKLLDKIGSTRVMPVWSMWGGYWARDDCAIRRWAQREAIQTSFVHSGGHAWPEDLERLVDAIGAKQTVWVHTEWDGTTSR